MIPRAVAFGIVAVVASGCSDGSLAPITGSINISVSTTGDIIDRDPDGYTVHIKDGQSFSLVKADTTIGDLRPSSYQVTLEGIADNCSVTSPNPVTIDIIANDATPVLVTFSVSCALRTGSILVSTVTSGDDTDTDGYALFASGVAGVVIPPNGVRTISGVRSGARSVRLAGLTQNCLVEGTNPRNVNVPYKNTAEIVFAIQCVRSGSLELTITSTGVHADPDGYRFNFFRTESPAGGHSAYAPHNGMVTSPALLPGNYKLDFFNLAANCDTSIPVPRSIALGAGEPTRIGVDVDCTAPAELAFVSNHDGDREISVVQSNGAGRTRLTFSPGLDVNPAWSPDGSRIAFASTRDVNFEIYVMRADGQDADRLTTSASADRTPAWSPDGRRIAFSSERDGNSEIYLMNSDGTNPVRLTSSLSFDSEPVWSPDGKRIIFSSDRDGGTLWTMNADGSGAARFTAAASQESKAAWSPDGTRIAFSRKLSDYGQAIFIMNADGSGQAEQLSEAFETTSDPAWSADGRKLAFTATECDYYGRVCVPYIVFISAYGVQHTTEIPTQTSEPTWRP